MRLKMKSIISLTLVAVRSRLPPMQALVLDVRISTPGSTLVEVHLMQAMMSWPKKPRRDHREAKYQADTRD